MSTFHSQLVEHITPFNDAMHMPDVAGSLDDAAAASRRSTGSSRSRRR